MGNPRRFDSPDREHDVRVGREEATGESRRRSVPVRPHGQSRAVAARNPSRANKRRRGVNLSYQRFFCPQCGHPIKEFQTDISDTGYRMEARCPDCKQRVQGAVEMKMDCFIETSVVI
jgi:hypothetical protein